LRATYSGLTHNEEGGAIITHDNITSDEAAQKAIAIFNRRWQSATFTKTKEAVISFPSTTVCRIAILSTYPRK
jgi:hypothetical protein